MSVLDEWINPYYLSYAGIQAIRESVLAKPKVKYAVLDNFFVESKLDQLIAEHAKLPFNEEIDRRAHGTGQWLPYDGAVVFAKKDVHFGSELFFNVEWHQYLAYLTDCQLKFPASAEVKLRWHKPDATGFWIHTDSTIRQLVAICYFNKGWTHKDGGLLQLWRVDEATDQHAPIINGVDSHERLVCLNQFQRIRTSTPGGGFPDNRQHDMVLIDQIVPTYNRLFLCNYQYDPAYHSVTPSNGKVRTGFVQWLGVDHGG